MLGGDKKLPAPLGLSTAGPQSQGGGGEGGVVKVLPGPKGREGTLGGNGGSWGAPGGAGGAGANGGKGEGGIQTQQSWSFPSGGGGGGGDPPVYAAPPAQQSQSVGGGKIPPPLQPGQRPVRLLPIRPRSRGARRSLRTFPVVTLHPRFPFNV